MEQAALPTTGPAPARPPAVGEAAPTPAPQPRSAKRHVRNYLLDKPLQLRLASYLLVAAAALSLGLGALLWQAYRETSRVIALGDPDAGDSIERALASEDRWRIVLLGAALAMVLVCLLGAALVITHRIAGPAFVLGRTCRQIGEGSLARPRPLRSRDLLVDLADDVAAMVDSLRDREGRERDAIQAAVAALRDPASGPDARAAAAAELERLASDKEARLRS
jgi:methyl-accepting chemotaxis protein